MFGSLAMHQRSRSTNGSWSNSTVLSHSLSLSCWCVYCLLIHFEFRLPIANSPDDAARSAMRWLSTFLFNARPLCSLHCALYYIEGFENLITLFNKKKKQFLYRFLKYQMAWITLLGNFRFSKVGLDIFEYIEEFIYVQLKEEFYIIFRWSFYKIWRENCLLYFIIFFYSNKSHIHINNN